ncbi:MAG: hypothetical protein AAGC60_11025 [Acidobacteriota bacterium]
MSTRRTLNSTLRASLLRASTLRTVTLGTLVALAPVSMASEPTSFSDLQVTGPLSIANKITVAPNRALAPTTKAASSYFSDRSSFETAAPGLPLEDFSSATVSPGDVVDCGNPVTQGNPCFGPGGLADGLSITTDNGNIVALGTGIFGNTTPMMAADLFASVTILEFTHTDVYAVGLNLATAGGPENLQITIEDIFGAPLDLTETPSGPTLSFWGVVSEAPIGRIILRSPSGAGEVVDEVQFGTPGCAATTYDFEDGTIDPAWTLVGVGHTNQESVEIVDDGGNLELALTSDGASAYYGVDNAGFLYQELTGDFRIETTLDSTTMTTGKEWRKAGLMARASLDHFDIRLLAMLAPVQERLQFVAREVYGGVGNVKVATEVLGAPSAVCLAIERSGQVLTVEYSLDDGTTWIQPPTGLGGSIEILALPPTLYVGLAMVSNNVSVTSTALFDDVSICPEP